MRTLIFSSKIESEDIAKQFEGQIFTLYPGSKAVGALLNYLDNNENAVAVLVGEQWTGGWSTPHPCNILFSSLVHKTPHTTIQARGRVRPIEELNDG